MRLTSINNIRQKIQRPAAFCGKKENALNTGQKGTIEQSPKNSPTGGSKHFVNCSFNYFQGKKTPEAKRAFDKTMPEDVLLIYKIAREISENITECAPKIKDGFESADVTLIFNRQGKIVQIFDNKTKEDYTAQKRSARPLYYGKLKTSAQREYLPDTTLDNGEIIWLETLRYKNGKPASADMRGEEEGQTYRARFKDGVLSRFEMSEEKGKYDKTIQILNLKEGRPEGYIKLECPSEVSSKNIRWAKFYDLFDDKWHATPPD